MIQSKSKCCNSYTAPRSVVKEVLLNTLSTFHVKDFHKEVIKHEYLMQKPNLSIESVWLRTAEGRDETERLNIILKTETGGQIHLFFIQRAAINDCDSTALHV